MPDPILYCPSVAYSAPEDPNPDNDANPTHTQITGSGGSEGRASAELDGRGGTGASEAKPNIPSCVVPALMSLASCGAIVSTQGVATLVAGASCLASLVAVDECLARQRAAAK